jgi:hypothetical protein
VKGATDVYLAGDTTSTAAGGFAAVGTSIIQNENGGGQDGLFVIMPSSLAAAPTDRTYLGGSGSDSLTAVALDPTAATFDAWVAGNTTSADLAVANAAPSSAEAQMHS